MTQTDIGGQPMDFAGEHRRQRAKPGNGTDAFIPPEPETPDPVPPRNIAGVGKTFFEMVQSLQDERDSLARDLNTANARIEQFQIAQNDLRSQLETARLELKEANDKIATENAERIRYSVAIEQAIITFRSLLSQPEQATER